MIKELGVFEGTGHLVETFSELFDVRLMSGKAELEYIGPRQAMFSMTEEPDGDVESPGGWLLDVEEYFCDSEGCEHEWYATLRLKGSCFFVNDPDSPYWELDVEIERVGS